MIFTVANLTKYCCWPWLAIWHILSILDSVSNWIKEVHKKQLGKIVVEKQQYTNLTNRSIGGQLSNVKNGIHILVHSNNWSKVANNFFALSDLLCFFYHVPNVSYLFFIFVDKNINHSMKRYLSVSIIRWKMNLSLQHSFWGLCILQ